jgi:hypothetical protein
MAKPPRRRGVVDADFELVLGLAEYVGGCAEIGSSTGSAFPADSVPLATIGRVESYRKRDGGAWGSARSPAGGCRGAAATRLRRCGNEYL